MTDATALIPTPLSMDDVLCTIVCACMATNPNNRPTLSTLLKLGLQGLDERTPAAYGYEQAEQDSSIFDLWKRIIYDAQIDDDDDDDDPPDDWSDTLAASSTMAGSSTVAPSTRASSTIGAPSTRGPPSTAASSTGARGTPQVPGRPRPVRTTRYPATQFPPTPTPAPRPFPRNQGPGTPDSAGIIVEEERD